MDLLTYTVTTALIAAAPGPVMATIALRSLAGATSDALAFAAGVILSETVMLAAAIAGALALLEAAPGVLAVAAGSGGLSALGRDRPLAQSAAGPGAGGPAGMASLSAGFVIGVANPYNATST